MTGWTEEEVRASVSKYLELLKADQEGEKINKAVVYRELSSQYPQRSPKAFELKFQNISAILYELHLPFCSGLKPRQNYQKLLKLIVLDEIDRSPIPAVEPHEILLSKLKQIGEQGNIRVRSKGTGRFGLAIEEALGIPQNSDKSADFMGIELKTKSDNSLQTLFSRTPSKFIQDIDKTTMFQRHSYRDEKRDRLALYTSFSSVPDSLGFYLKPTAQYILVKREGTDVLSYEAEKIEEALLSKHSQTAFISLEVTKGQDKEFCKISNAQYCKWPSIIRFLKLVDEGEIYLDFTMSQKESGSVKDHGFLWRIRSRSIPELYLSTKEITL
jgi:hypothetical protein